MNLLSNFNSYEASTPMFNFNYDNGHLYTILEMQKAMVSPFNLAAKTMQDFNINPMNPLAYTQTGRTIAASFELFERITRQYGEPDFGIKKTSIGKKEVQVSEHKVFIKAFCDLLHFKKSEKIDQPKLLIVAPMSGHYATLLRGTVEAALPFFDVYITDWKNARDIPLSKGGFDLDDYIEYLIEFFHILGPDVHVMAVCQPSVPVLASISLMADMEDKKKPKSMILIGGPIDTRINPTKVNDTAVNKPLGWFEQNAISRVPLNYLGFMRSVYPGFLQLTGFMTMNLDRHIGEHYKLFLHLVEGDGEAADAHKKFYNEYLSVMDIPAEFYLQTIKTVFKDYALPNGTMLSRGRNVRPEAISKTAIMCIEGELDDISGVGQTKAALTLCKNIPKEKKLYHLQKDVGHYGSFNGRKFREFIMPAIVDFCKKNA